jgi:hypothetical protein
MQHRNGVGRDSNFRNQRERGWNGGTGRVRFMTLLSDVVWARFFSSVLTLTSFLLQDNRNHHGGDRYRHHHQSFYPTEKPTNLSHQATIEPPHEKKIDPKCLMWTTGKPLFVKEYNKKKKEEEAVAPAEKKFDPQTTTILVSNPVAEKEKDAKMMEIVGSNVVAEMNIDHKTMTIVDSNKVKEKEEKVKKAKSGIA